MLMHSKSRPSFLDGRIKKSRPACCCSGNFIIAGVKQPLFTLIYNPPPPIPPLALLLPTVHQTYTRGEASPLRLQANMRMVVIKQNKFLLLFEDKNVLFLPNETALNLELPI